MELGGTQLSVCEAAVVIRPRVCAACSAPGEWKSHYVAGFDFAALARRSSASSPLAISFRQRSDTSRSALLFCH